MVKVITIDGKECTFKSSAAIPRIYRMKFRRDLFADMAKLNAELEKTKKEGSPMPITSLEIFENIAYVMHKHGDSSQPNNVLDWMDQFNMFDIYQVLPEIIKMWQIETFQASQSKKTKRAR